MSREKLAHDYLIFRSPTEYIIVFLPVMVGLFANVFNNSPNEISSVGPDTIMQFQRTDIDSYIFFSKLTITILIAFFICYRWSNMLQDGSYGFWLTTGIVRQSFFIRTIIKFTILLLFTQFLGILFLAVMNQYYLLPQLIFRLTISILSGVFFQVVLAVFLGNLISNPEFSSLTFITLMGFNLGFNNTDDNFLYLLFQSDLAYNSDNVYFAVLLSFVSSIVMILISLRVHMSLDIDI